MKMISAEPKETGPARVLLQALRKIWRLLLEMLVALGMVIGAGFGLAACTFEIGTPADSTAQTTTTVAATTTTSAAARPGITGSTNVVTAGNGLASPAQTVAEVLAPSVVNITVKVTVAGLFGQEYTTTGEGSGVIYSTNGMIITNNHVITNNGEPVDGIEVTLITGEKLSGTVVGTDPLTDLAVVKVEPDHDLPPATFVAELPNVGEYAVAIGSPLGYENSVTLGIVSGLGRSIKGAIGSQAVALINLIQTDAPISPGNSGGALANASGQVVGINVAYEPPGTGAVSIGFAIPSVVVTQVADEIISTGRATHAYIGVSSVTLTADLQKQYGLSRSSGILIVQVNPGGPAARVGLQQGDIIVKLDDKEVTESAELLTAIRDKKPGDTVDVTIDRDGVVSVITVTLEERPLDLT